MRCIGYKFVPHAVVGLYLLAHSVERAAKLRNLALPMHLNAHAAALLAHAAYGMGQFNNGLCNKAAERKAERHHDRRNNAENYGDFRNYVRNAVLNVLYHCAEKHRAQIFAALSYWGGVVYGPVGRVGELQRAFVRACAYSMEAERRLLAADEHITHLSVRQHEARLIGGGVYLHHRIRIHYKHPAAHFLRAGERQ